MRKCGVRIMNSELITYLFSNLSFGSLFVWLLWDTRKDGKERKDKYQGTIDKLSDKIAVIQEIKADVEAIKDKVK